MIECRDDASSDRKRTERSAARALVEDAGGDGAAEFRLRHLIVAGNFEAGAAVFDRATATAPRRSGEAERWQEEPLQHFHDADRGDESAARNQENAAARGRINRKGFRGRTLQSPSEPRVEGSSGGRGLAGNRRFRSADVTRGKSARCQITPRTLATSSSDGAKRTGG